MSYPYHPEIYESLEMELTREQIICIKCQECCKWTTFTIKPLGFERTAYEVFFKARGCKVIPMGEGEIAIVVPTVCPQLTEHGCRIYNNRPWLCKAYDGRKDFLIDCKLREQNDAEEDN